MSSKKSRSLGDWIAAAALCGYAVFFYRGVLFTDRVYVFRDLVTFFYSLEHLARVLADWGWPPTWNPFAVLGKPFAADPLAGVWYPPNWLLRQLPVALGFNLSLAMHHAWGAAGMLLLARHLGLSTTAAALAGLLFGFAGPMVSCDNVYNGLVAAAWAPWVILAFARWCDRPSFAPLALVAVCLAMSLLGAMPEFTLFTAALLLGVALDCGRERDGPQPAVLIAAIGGAALLAAGLCGALLLPAAEYVAQSSRAGGLNVANALENSLRPSGLASFLVARWNGDWIDPPWLLTLYFGPVLALAVLAPLLLPARRRWWIFAPLVFVGLALGEHLPGYAWVIERVAWLRLVRYPEKFLLAAHGLLALAAGAGLELLVRRWARAGALAAVAVVVFTASDLYRANGELLPSAPWSEVILAPSSTRLMETGDDPLRIYSNGVGLPALPPYPQGLRLEEDLLLFQTANLHQIANLNAPATINLVDHEELERLLETVDHERVAALLGSFNTAYVTSARPLERPELTLMRAPSTPLQAYVYRVEPLAPRVFVPRQVSPASSADDALAILRQAESPAANVVLEGEPAAAASSDVVGRASLTRYLPSRVDIRASMRTSGFVVLGDSFAPGWQARVDGAPAVIRRANRFARAVEVAAGEHEIVFTYAPASQMAGVAISVVVGLGMVGWAVLARR